MKKLWIIASISCDSCGREVSLSLKSGKPTEEDVQKNKDEIGGMFCITTIIREMEIDGKIETGRGD